jgi:hypothetical protein
MQRAILHGVKYLAALSDDNGKDILQNEDGGFTIAATTTSDMISM